MGRPRIATRRSCHAVVAIALLWATAARAQGVAGGDSLHAAVARLGLRAPQPAHPVGAFEGQSLVPVQRGGDPTPLPFTWSAFAPRYPRVGISVGAAGRLSGFRDIDAAFRRVEDSYRAAGYTVQRADAARLTPVLLWALAVDFQPTFGFTVDIASGTGNESHWNVADGMAVTRWPLRRAAGDAGAAAFAGLGGGVYDFAFLRRYGALISAVDSNGGYQTLDSVTLRGAGPCWSAVGGVVMNPTARMTLIARIQYVGTGALTTVAPGAGRVRVDTSGAIAGASFGYAF